MGGFSVQPTAITPRLNYRKGQQRGSSCQDVAIRGGISSIGDHTGGKDTRNKPINRVERRGAVDADNSTTLHPAARFIVQSALVCCWWRINNQS